MKSRPKKEDYYGIETIGMMDEATDKYLSSLESYIDYLESKDKWIPVEDRLPPVGEYEDVSIDVLVSNDKEWGHGSYRHDVKKWNYYFVGKIEQDDNAITHWKEAPKLPEVG